MKTAAEYTFDEIYASTPLCSCQIQSVVQMIGQDAKLLKKIVKGKVSFLPLDSYVPRLAKAIKKGKI